MGSYGAVIEEDALEFLADMAGGDARSALNAIELGILTTPRNSHTFTAFGVYRIALGIVVLVIWGVQTFVLKAPAAV